LQEKHWKLTHQPSADELNAYANKLGVPPLVAALMMSRGIASLHSAKAFFNPSLGQLHDPFLMDEMDTAVNRIQTALDNKERIRIYGDYDVDGTTSVAVVFHFLSQCFDQIDYYIPDRDREGYGISLESVEDAIEKDIKLVIALDCGVRSVELIRHAAGHGVDYIVCDHHLPGAELPPTVALLNPKKPNCNYPFKELSGCGIGWKLVQALCLKWSLPDESYLRYLDMLAVSIASDLVIMTGENRALAALGIERLEKNPSRGLEMIVDRFIRSDKQDLKLDVMKIVFMIGPRINAAGRLADAKVAVRLLLAENEQEAEELSSTLNQLNQERRGLDKDATEDALHLIKSDIDYPNKFTTVVQKDDWHKGVVGIVASRLLENYYKPTIVLTAAEDGLVGSARSIEGFDIHEALVNCSDYLLQFGGHKYAAGMKLKRKNLEAFKIAFDNYAKTILTKEDLIPVIKYDAELSLNLVNYSLFKMIGRFAPFGPNNLQPLFLSQGVWDTGNSRTMGPNHEHIRLNLVSKDRNEPISAIGFNMGQYYKLIQSGAPISILYHVDENHFNGNSSLQLMLRDIKFMNEH